MKHKTQKKHKKKAVIFNLVFTALVLSLLSLVIIFNNHLIDNEINVGDYIINKNIKDKHLMAEEAINKIYSEYDIFDFNIENNGIKTINSLNDYTNLNKLKNDLQNYFSFSEDKNKLSIVYKNPNVINISLIDQKNPDIEYWFSNDISQESNANIDLFKTSFDEFDRVEYDIDAWSASCEDIEIIEHITPSSEGQPNSITLSFDISYNDYNSPEDYKNKIHEITVDYTHNNQIMFKCERLTATFPILTIILDQNLFQYSTSVSFREQILINSIYHFKDEYNPKFNAFFDLDAYIENNGQIKLPLFELYHR